MVCTAFQRRSAGYDGETVLERDQFGVHRAQRLFPLRFAVAGEPFVLTSSFIERGYWKVGIGEKPNSDKRTLSGLEI